MPDTSKPAAETRMSLSQDGLVLACLTTGSILILSILTAAPLLPTLGVLCAALLTLSVYLRRGNETESLQKLPLSETALGDARSSALSELTEVMPRAVAILSQTGEVLYANQRAQDLLSPDMVGRPVGAYLRNSALRPALESAFAGEAVETLPIHVLAPTELFIDVDLSEPVTIRTDSIATRGREVVFAVLADRTQATTAREKRADFLANASHELKTPIASLKGYIETLRGHAKDDPKARETFLGIMQEQAERMERLVTDLLSLRKIESSEHIAPAQTADLVDALKTACDVVQPLADQRNVRLSLDIPDGPAQIFGKTDECIQLFVNLIENAVKLSVNKTQVDVTLKRQAAWAGAAFSSELLKGGGLRRIVNRLPSEDPVWHVQIVDTGPGISRTHLPRIGERFYRVAGDLPAQEKGTGLGLAIVKHIVMRHRAGWFVKSAHDAPVSGTAFAIVFTALTDSA